MQINVNLFPSASLPSVFTDGTQRPRKQAPGSIAKGEIDNNSSDDNLPQSGGNVIQRQATPLTPLVPPGPPLTPLYPSGTGGSVTPSVPLYPQVGGLKLTNVGPYWPVPQGYPTTI